MKNNPKKLFIIKAAQRRFVRHGLKKTSIEEIARDLRIGKATIYHYFKSKEEIFGEVIKSETDKFVDEINLIFIDQDSDLKQKLEKYIELKLQLPEKFSLINELITSSFQNDIFDIDLNILNNFIEKDSSAVINFLKNHLNKKQMNSKIAEFFVHQSWSFYFSKQTKINSQVEDDQKKFKNQLIDYFISQIIQ